jgi:hypothetical protein
LRPGDRIECHEQLLGDGSCHVLEAEGTGKSADALHAALKGAVTQDGRIRVEELISAAAAVQ